MRVHRINFGVLLLTRWSRYNQSFSIFTSAHRLQQLTNSSTIKRCSKRGRPIFLNIFENSTGFPGIWCNLFKVYTCPTPNKPVVTVKCPLRSPWVPLICCHIVPPVGSNAITQQETQRLENTNRVLCSDILAQSGTVELVSGQYRPW